MKKKLLSMFLSLAVILSLCMAINITAGAAQFSMVNKAVESGVCYLNGDTDTTYDTVKEAVEAVEAAGTTASTIIMSDDSTESDTIIIYEDLTITLDLNGYALKGTGSARVINNKGVLTVKDSNASGNTSYFKVNEDGLWVLDESSTDAKYNFDIKKGLTDANGKAVTAVPAEGEVIAVKGGCITGGAATSNGNTKGGAIYNFGTLIVNGGNIIGNTAQNGGGIYNNNGTATISGSIVSGNTATNYGGGVYGYADADHSTTISDKSYIAYNVSENGAGIYNSAYQDSSTYVTGTGVLNITDSVIKGNKVTGDGNGRGGGIYNFRGVLSIASTKVENNEAIYGGGVYNRYGKTDITDSTISSNKTTKSGGGIYNCTSSDLDASTSGVLNITESTISSNSAAGSGGGLYNDGGAVTVKSGSIISNTAVNYGGGIYDNGKIAVSGKMIVNNNKIKGVNNNLYIASGTPIEIQTSLSKGSEIGITHKTNPTADSSVTVAAANEEDYSSYFTSDNLAYKVRYNNKCVELAEYDLSAITSNTIAIALENEDMTTAQAIAVAKAQMPYTELTEMTLIIFAKTDDGTYSYIAASDDSDWSAGFDLTLAEIIENAGSTDCFCIGQVTNHDHAWTYTAEGSTLTASCTDNCPYAAEDKSITLTAPADLTYNGKDKTAAFDSETFCGGELPEITYMYKASEDGEYEETDDISKAGWYKASAVAGDGAAAKTVSVEYEIAKAELEVTGTTADDKTYDGTKYATVHAGTLSGKAEGTDVEIDTATGTFESEDAANGITVTVEYTLKGEDASNYTIKDSTTVADIEKRSLTLESGSANKTYDGTELKNSEITVSGDGWASDEDAEYTVTGSRTDAGVSENTFTYTLKKGTDANNYSIIAKYGELTVSPKQLAVSGTAAEDKVYDGTTSAKAAAGSLTGKVEGDDVTVSVKDASFDSKDAGDRTVTVKYELSGKDAANYAVPEESRISANITKRYIVVSADNKASYVGSELEALTYTASELGEGDSWTGELSTKAKKDVPGTYDITIGTLRITGEQTENNYTITYNKGIYEVTEKNVQELSFDSSNVDKTYGDANFTAAVKGAATAVTYSSSDPEVASVDESTGEITILKAGSTVISAAAEETAEYAAGEAQFTLTVNKVKVDVPEAVTGLVYNGSEQTGVTVPEGAPYTVSGNTGTDAGSYTATAALKDEVNYEWNAAAAGELTIEWSIDKLEINVKADNRYSYLYEELASLTYKADSLMGNDKFTGSIKTAAKKNKSGTYRITEGTLSAGDNYSIVFTEGTYTVKNPAPAKRLMAKGKAYKTSIKYTWTKVDGAAKYKVYFVKCGYNATYKCVKTTTSTSFTKKNLKKGVSYKAYVVAYDKNGNVLKTSPKSHIRTNPGIKANATAVKADSEIILQLGSKKSISAKISAKDSKGTLLWKGHLKNKLRYYSSNSKIAKVDSNGKITATGRGVVNIYTVAPSGAYAVTKVRVLGTAK